MNYKDPGFKPRDDWILSKDVMIARARFRSVLTVLLHSEYYYNIKENKVMAEFKTFQMKMYGDEDEKLTRLAEIANTDKTTLAKRRIFSDEEIIILDKSNYISRSLIELNDKFSAAMRDGKLPEDKYTKFYDKLCEISTAFVAVSKELTIFKDQQEGGDV